MGRLAGSWGGSPPILMGWGAQDLEFDPWSEVRWDGRWLPPPFIVRRPQRAQGGAKFNGRAKRCSRASPSSAVIGNWRLVIGNAGGEHFMSSKVTCPGLRLHAASTTTTTTTTTTGNMETTAKTGQEKPYKKNRMLFPGVNPYSSLQRGFHVVRTGARILWYGKGRNPGPQPQARLGLWPLGVARVGGPRTDGLMRRSGETDARRRPGTILSEPNKPLGFFVCTSEGAVSVRRGEWLRFFSRKASKPFPNTHQNLFI